MLNTIKTLNKELISTNNTYSRPSLISFIKYLLYGNIEKQEVIDTSVKLSESDLNGLYDILSNMNLHDFYEYLSVIDKTSDIIVDIDEHGLVYSPINDLTLVSSLLKKMIDNGCYINLTFDKMLLVRIFCETHNIKFKEYAIMFNLKKSCSKMLKSFTVIDYDDIHIMNTYLFNRLDSAIDYLIQNSIIRSLITGYTVKEITGMKIERYYVGDFINNVFI